jgi:hypothetical protein
VDGIQSMACTARQGSFPSKSIVSRLLKGMDHATGRAGGICGMEHLLD